MSRYRNRPVVVDAIRWLRNGDHPGDEVGAMLTDPLNEDLPYRRLEGKIVRYFRHPDPEFTGDNTHEVCGFTWHDHGWIDSGGGGQTVCPGDWVITDTHGRVYPCKDTLFRATFQPVVEGDD